jgi:hypothetical protein
MGEEEGLQTEEHILLLKSKTGAAYVGNTIEELYLSIG